VISPNTDSHLEPSDDAVDLLGTRVHRLSVQDLLQWFQKTIDSERRGLVNYVNAHALNLAYEIP
jgi:UDP-N-acetyl-D-mannosaminuronic acid transferase (WecB/TagA/CpsF family)